YKLERTTRILLILGLFIYFWYTLFSESRSYCVFANCLVRTKHSCDVSEPDIFAVCSKLSAFPVILTLSPGKTNKVTGLLLPTQHEKIVGKVASSLNLKFPDLSSCIESVESVLSLRCSCK